MTTLVLLQNPWSPVYAGSLWPRDSWLRALWRSRTGQRLGVLLAAALLGTDDIWADNTTLKVATVATGTEAPDIDHLSRLLASHPFDRVVACGNQATRVMWDMYECGAPRTQMWLPHPAYWPLTNQLLIEAGQTLGAGWSGIVVYQQGRGFVAQSWLDWPDPQQRRSRRIASA